MVKKQDKRKNNSRESNRYSLISSSRISTRKSSRNTNKPSLANLSFTQFVAEYSVSSKTIDPRKTVNLIQSRANSRDTFRNTKTIFREDKESVNTGATIQIIPKLKVSDYFEKYIEVKHFSKAKYFITYEEFSRIQFDAELPEIFYDIMYYICKHILY